MAIPLPDTSSIPSHALDALQEDALLPICKTCGTQYPSPRDDCPICEDPRQWVPASGQAWTSLADLGSKSKHSLLPDKEDVRISHIITEPAFAIGQTPFLIETAGGSYIWECSAFLSLGLIGHLSELKKPLKAMAISHPHFFSSSLTWSRALNIPLYICAADKEWYSRIEDLKDSDDVRFWSGEVELGPGVKLVQCGGHFPGSCVFYWDRLSEPPPSSSDLPTKPTPVSGIIFTSDTLMVQPNQTHFTFAWSIPNMIPMRPKAVLRIKESLKGIEYSQATSSWPERWIREDAKKALNESVVRYLGAEGWRFEGDSLIELVTQ
ncbi:hydrolase [Cryptococcus neoformans C23]|uniref:Hydrolase n=1 Tax=Cryptococcus neoformans (strain H99 / ATCC 208821 / CBS 10515 / FGSC 9487) TaxID=235443 RepID=J9VYQ7_CRYN9|nr:hydrolase [Cryptococcus neoformans var. grubii H99]OWZ27553.1 hydrolase [Cryptococcus neoformans var. grubii AD2-60a]OWZ39857.1 hydrolase [Cryptococcus neoformans var. grubii C23]OXC82097.1 hydrolase [Cryptococcus neoformans var. grubii AD1-7a]OXG27510.1 hydrolase [Cryptococcus neoformans var. grubii Bt15]OXG34349.1 hydrolase [Cryptococcus neoformans var. grubii Bt120]OXH25407.1 hydrolase [Cryptococcus neoformans var. grubii]|eukprot:XP_012052378.1 hydrolase [Cryptococcus neoformans var. grubii H99]